MILLILALITPTPSPTPVPGPMHRLKNGTEVAVTSLIRAAGRLIPQMPGYWRNGGYYVPCNATVPYQSWVSPDPNNPGVIYMRGDMDVMLLTPALYPTGVDAMFGNHTRGAYDKRGMMIPLYPQLGPPNYYPVPPDVSELCTQWSSYPNTIACPSGASAQQYTNAFQSNGVWRNALQFYQPDINADCSGPQPTWTPTRTATPAVTPTATPTPGPNPFVNWVYQAVAEGWFAGCGPHLFCPGSTDSAAQGLVSRAQMAYYVLVLYHGPTYQPPKCTPPGQFTDIPCYP